MEMYKEGSENPITVEKGQVEVLKKAGWTTEPNTEQKQEEVKKETEKPATKTAASTATAAKK